MIFINAVLCAFIFLFMLLLIGLVIHTIVNVLVNLISLVTNKYIAYFLCNIVTFVGVIHHELSHVLMVFMTGAKLLDFKLFDIKDNISGYVNFIARGPWLIQSIQYTLISTAPMYIGLLSLYLLHNIYSLGYIHKYLYHYVFISIVLHMRLSPQDLKSAGVGLPIFFCLLVFIFSRLNIIII